MMAKQAEERDRDGDNPFSGTNHGDEKVDLRHLGDTIELRPVEIHVNNGALNGKPSFAIVMVGTTHQPHCVHGQITLEMFNEGLKEIGYKIVKE